MNPFGPAHAWVLYGIRLVIASVLLTLFVLSLLLSIMFWKSVFPPTLSW